MQALNLRNILVGLAMLAGAGLAFALTPTQKAADKGPQIDLETAVPKQFGDWRVDESIRPVIPSPDVQANLDLIYDQILSRTYINSQGQRIMLSLTYGSSQTQELRAHRQEVCYAAQGFKIHDLHHTQASIAGTQVPVTRMFAVQGARHEPVTYWFTMGNHIVVSRLERQIVQLRYAFSGYIPDGYLMRISNLTDNPSQGFNAHLQFANDMFQALDPRLAHRLLGRGDAA